MADTALAVRSWWANVVERVFPGKVDPGVAAADQDVVQEYGTLNSMSAMSRFPWVRACVHAKAGDLAGLPLIAIRTVHGQRDRLPDHPALQRLQNPGGGVTGTLFRKQLVVDFALTGNNYIWDLPTALGRLHPASMVPQADRLGNVSHYEWSCSGQMEDIPAGEVLHARDVSWQDTLEQILGEGAIRSLNDSLVAEMYAAQNTAKSARRGRIEMLFSVKDASALLTAPQVKKITDKYELATRKGQGAFFVGSPFDVKPLSLTPREMEYAKMRELNMFAVLAVFDVPPVRVGLPSANYGTSKQQMRSYWESLRHQATFFDDQFSRLTGDPNVRIEHDFSWVEALQVSYTERQVRVERWIKMGATPKEAARYEGFVDAPLTDDAVPMASVVIPPARRPEEPQDKTLEAYFEAACGRYQRACRGGTIPDHLVLTETARLDEVLAPLGMAHRASEIAELTDEAVRQVLAITGDVVLAGTSIFSAERAQRLQEAA